jgi:basic amino acid/polyamine antiporter, APA family
MAQQVSLVRQLGVPSAAALVVSNMVGASIFTTTGFLAMDLGQVNLVLGIWLVGAFVALAGAFCYSELGVNFPSSGGEYVYLTQAYGPVWGFMTGWVSLIAGFSAPIAASALSFSNYMAYFFPSLRGGQEFLVLGPEWLPLRIGWGQVVAMLVILAMTAVNFLDIQAVARAQNWFTAFKISVLVAFIVAGFLAGDGNWGHLSQNTERASSVPIFNQFFVSLCFVSLGYSGWNAATYIAEELKQPERTLPLALAAGTATVAVLYLVLNVLYIYAVPLAVLKEPVIAVASTAAAALFGKSIAGAFSLVMALALFATVNAMVTIGPRVYYAMAKNKAFFAMAAELSPRTRTPLKAIVLQCLVAMSITVTPLPDLMLFIGFTLNIFTVITVASIFIFRRRPNWRKLPVVNFLYPLFPVVYIAVGLWIVYYGLSWKPVHSLTALGLIAAGALIYKFRIQGNQTNAAHS